MKSINQEERQRAFIKFLFFFIITFILIIAIAFFSVQVPLKENKQLKAEKLAMESQIDSLETFENVIQPIIDDINSLDTLKSTLQVDAAIDENIKHLYIQVQDKSNATPVINLRNLILDNLSNYHSAKVDQRSKDNSSDAIQQLKTDRDTYKKAWADCLNSKASRTQ